MCLFIQILDVLANEMLQHISCNQTGHNKQSRSRSNAIRLIDKNTTVDIMTFDSVYNVCCYPLATHITL